MQTKTVRRARIAAIALAPVFAFATPSIASAAGPGEAQQFEQTKTTTDRNGVQSTTTQSCMGEDGEVSFQRNSGAANENGKSETTTNSGDASCSGDVSDGQENNAVQNANEDSDSVRDAASERIPNSGAAPLVVINTPPAG